MLTGLLTTVTREVPRLKDETDRQYEVRRIGGYSYHLYSDDSIAERAKNSYFSIADAMPVIYGLFWKRLEEGADLLQLAQLEAEKDTRNQKISHKEKGK